MLLKGLFNNDDLVKALIYIDPDFLSKSIPSDFDRTSLLYDRIWPFRYVPDIQDEGKSLISSHWQYRSSGRNDTYMLASVTFYVFVHIDWMRTEHGLRTDFIIAEIEKSRKQTDLIGAGKFRFGRTDDFIVDTGGKWLGGLIEYQAINLGEVQWKR